MRPLLKLILPALLLLATLAAPAPAPAAVADGVWEGRIGSVLRCRIHLRTSPTGREAFFDSPDQGATDLPLALVHLSDDSITVDLVAAGARFRGRFADGGRALRGTWSQGGQDAPLELTRLDAPPDDSRPQEPKPPYPYDVNEVTFAGSASGVTLSGTLTRPRGDARVPAVVLVTGSGPQDRDSQISGHKSFKLMADRFTRAGIAVLRYDERGIGRSTGQYAAALTVDFAADAAAAVAFLRTRPDIDGARIAVLGHSEGGIVAPWVAARDPKLAAIVSLAGPTIRGDRLLESQSVALMRAAGRDSAGQERTMRFNREVWRHVFEDTPVDTAAARVERSTRAFVLGLPASDLAQLGDAQAFIQSTRAQVTNPWFRAFVRHDPGPDLARVRVPMLAYFAERDLQVTPDANLPALQQHFSGARAKLLTTRRWPGLNHLFQTATTGLPAEYSLIGETLAPQMLEALTEWLRTTLRAGS